jgi:hypothetical protein
MVKTMTNHDDLGWPISRQSFSNPSCWGFSHYSSKVLGVLVLQQANLVLQTRYQSVPQKKTSMVRHDWFHKNLPWSRQLFILSVPLCPTKRPVRSHRRRLAPLRIRPFGRRNLSGVIDVEEVEIIPCSSDSRGDGDGSGHPGEWRQVFFGEVLNWGIPKTKGFDTKRGHPHFRKALYIFYIFGRLGRPEEAIDVWPWGACSLQDEACQGNDEAMAWKGWQTACLDAHEGV